MTEFVVFGVLILSSATLLCGHGMWPMWPDGRSPRQDR